MRLFREGRHPGSRSPCASLTTAFLTAALSLALLSGCSSFSSDEKPLRDSTFVQMLTELHLAKARIAVQKPVPAGFRDSLFARHGVDTTAFNATLDYYSQRPDAFQHLYSGVIDTLQSLQRPQAQRSQKQRPDAEASEALRDSLYRAKQKESDPR